MLTAHVQAARTCEEASFLPCVAPNTIVLSLAGFAILVLAGCGGNSGGGDTQPTKTVVSIQIAPSNPSIVVGSQQQFTATAVFDDASQQDVTSSAAWTSSDLTKAGINNSGIATSVDIGRPQIKATYGSFTASTRLTIVIGPTLPVARFAFSEGLGAGGTNAFYRYVVDGATGLLHPGGYFAPLGESGEGIPPFPLGPIVDPRGKFLYFYYPKTLPLYVFSIDPASGDPSPVAGSPFDLTNVPTGLGEPRSLLLDPSGVFAYMWDSGVSNGQVFAFDVDPQTGAFATIQSLMVGTQGGELAIDPFGRFLYSGNLVFAIDPSTGELTQTSALTGPVLASLTISPGSKFAFGISDICSGKVSAFTVSATNGALSEVTGSPFSAGPDTYGLAVDPSGKFLYTAQAGSCDFESVPGAVSVFSISASGALSPVGAELELPNSAYSIQIDPTGKFAYVQVESFPTSGGTSVGIDVVSIGAGQQPRLIGGTLGDRLALSPGQAPVTYTPQSLYAVNAGSNNVSTYGIDASSGTLTLQGTIPAGSSPRAIAVTPQRQFAYVVNQDSDNASIYTVNSSNGALAPLGPIATGTAPDSVVVDLIGSSVYVANSASNDLSAFFINTSTGSLTPHVFAPFAAGTTPSGVAISPLDLNLLVANSGSNDVSVFYVDPASGGLSPVPSGIGVFPGSPQVFVAYDPMGRFFYVCSQTNEVSTYSEPFLTLVATTSAGTQPTAMAFDPTGRFTYIVDAAANNVLMYAIDPNDGSLMSTGTVATGTHPVSITVEPSGKFVYVANQDSNDISIYRADPNTGTLTPEGIAPAGTRPVSVAATATTK
jgi:6-phosphogluconolactonase (cycloisomerase 2 family)